VYKRTTYHQLPTTDVSAEGWLHAQLRVQADGLTGHLDEIWEDVGENSAWLGGDGESWERGPYYLDGLVPLAYLLTDEPLLAKARRWIDAILGSQEPSGQFGPAGNDDWWPRMVVLKAMKEYYDASGDDRVMEFMSRYFDYQRAELPDRPFFMWAVARGGENAWSALWFYERSGADQQLSLATTLLDGAFDWTGFFERLPYTRPMEEHLRWGELTAVWEKYGQAELLNPVHIGEEKARDLFLKYHTSHGVNIAMAVKYPALRYQLTGDRRHLESVRSGLRQLDRYHGQLHGLYSCDEHLNGTEPTTGVELCTVVEFMFSLEVLLAITGEAEFADRLERVAFNALPAALSHDFTSHQYDQQVNQVLCSVAHRDWYNNTDTSNIFGLAPHFPCCLANMHQGWPKLARSLWMRRESEDRTELTAMVYAPSSIRFASQGRGVTLHERTRYPFGDTIEFAVETDAEGVEFELRLRVPEWCESPGIVVDGAPVEAVERPFHSIRRTWRSGESVTLTLPMPPTLRRDEEAGTAYFTKGPLLYALPIPGDWKRIVDRGRFSDYEVHPNTDWAYGVPPAIALPSGVESNPEWNGLFDPESPPERMEVRLRRVKNWGLRHNSAAPIPKTPECEPQDTVVQLVPYGATALRVTLFPIC